MAPISMGPFDKSPLNRGARESYHKQARILGMTETTPLISIRRLLLRPETTAVCGAFALFVFFSVFSDFFLTRQSFISICNVVAELGIVSVGVTLLMIGGQFDLSIGPVIGLTSFVAVFLTNNLHLPSPVGFACALVFAVLLGAVNGLIVVRTGLHSFIVTLGTMMIFRGLLTAEPADFRSASKSTKRFERFCRGRFWVDSGCLSCGSS